MVGSSAPVPAEATEQRKHPRRKREKTQEEKDAHNASCVKHRQRKKVRAQLISIIIYPNFILFFFYFFSVFYICKTIFCFLFCKQRWGLNNLRRWRPITLRCCQSSIRCLRCCQSSTRCLRFCQSSTRCEVKTRGWRRSWRNRTQKCYSWKTKTGSWGEFLRTRCHTANSDLPFSFYLVL